MLTRQQNFYHQLLQLVDAVLLAFTIYAAHALRYYVLNDRVWFDSAPLDPQFANSYWMMVVALVAGPPRFTDPFAPVHPAVRRAQGSRPLEGAVPFAAGQEVRGQGRVRPARGG